MTRPSLFLKDPPAYKWGLDYRGRGGWTGRLGAAASLSIEREGVWTEVWAVEKKRHK